MKFSQFVSLVGLLIVSGSLRADTTNAALAKASVLESNVAYLRVSQVAGGLADELTTANRTLAATNKIVGTVLDLRFVDGGDALAAKSAANVFAAKKLPLAILVNGQTRGAAVALVKALRDARAGLVFGSVADGLKPDIAVAVGADEEKIYYADAYAVVTNTVVVAKTNSIARGTNRPFSRISEADLVRARREGSADPEQDLERAPTNDVAPEKPVLRDPVLTRAVDLLQGLAVLRARGG